MSLSVLPTLGGRMCVDLVDKVAVVAAWYVFRVTCTRI